MDLLDYFEELAEILRQVGSPLRGPVIFCHRVGVLDSDMVSGLRPGISSDFVLASVHQESPASSERVQRSNH